MSVHPGLVSTPVRLSHIPMGRQDYADSTVPHADRGRISCLYKGPAAILSAITDATMNVFPIRSPILTACLYDHSAKFSVAHAIVRAARDSSRRFLVNCIVLHNKQGRMLVFFPSLSPPSPINFETILDSAAGTIACAPETFRMGILNNL